MTRTAYTNARLIDPSTGLDEIGTLIIEDEWIAACGAEVTIPEGTEQIDCGGHILAPGLIDLSVHVGEPGAEHKETMDTVTHAAAAGGVTTIIIQPDTDPVIDDVAILEMVARRARKIDRVRVEAMGTITHGRDGEALGEIGLLKDAGAVAFTDAGRAIRSSAVMRRALSYADTLGALLITHAEDPDLGGAGVMNESELATRLGLPGIPSAAELIGLERDIRLSELTGARCHIDQISAAGSVDIMEDAKAVGIPVTCGVAAAHLTLNQNDIGEYRTFFRLSPPLRTEDDRQALIEGLARGIIDVVHSNHMPEDQEAKRQPFELAAIGAIGVETLLPAMLSLVHAGELELMTALRAVTSAPAQLLGLEEGTLDVGAPADLVVIDLNTPWVLTLDALHSKSKNTPYEDRRLQGRAIRTIVRGRTVFEL